MKLYHGTCTQLWRPEQNGFYLYVTVELEHALAHAKEKAESCDCQPVLIELDLNDMGDEFRREPDNDVHESDGYERWTDSLRDKGSFILVGDTRQLPIRACKIYGAREQDEPLTLT